MGTDPLMGRKPLRERKADRARGYASKMKAIVLLPGDLRHGTNTGYHLCKCRCSKCETWYEGHKRKQ